jgi:hypothetical protein
MCEDSRDKSFLASKLVAGPYATRTPGHCVRRPGFSVVIPLARALGTHPTEKTLIVSREFDYVRYPPSESGKQDYIPVVPGLFTA